MPQIFFGGGMWESNPPRTLQTPNTGFEDQEAHQLPFYPQITYTGIKSSQPTKSIKNFVNPTYYPIIYFCLITFLYYQIIVDFSRVFIHNNEYKLNFILECSLFYGFGNY